MAKSNISPSQLLAWDHSVPHDPPAHRIWIREWAKATWMYALSRFTNGALPNRRRNSPSAAPPSLDCNCRLPLFPSRRLIYWPEWPGCPRTSRIPPSRHLPVAAGIEPSPREPALLQLTDYECRAVQTVMRTLAAPPLPGVKGDIADPIGRGQFHGRSGRFHGGINHCWIESWIQIKSDVSRRFPQLLLSKNYFSGFALALSQGGGITCVSR